MEFSEFKEQLEALGESQRKAVRELLALASLGGKVRSEYAAHAEAASTYREFLDAVYADETLRFTPLWAAWAKADRKDWLRRFRPESQAQGVRLVRRAVPLEYAHGGALLIPADVRGQHAAVMVFADETVNTGAATFFTSIEGSFTCGGLEFDGTYDVFYDRGTVLFVRWALNGQGQRVSEARLADEFCKTG